MTTIPTARIRNGQAIALHDVPHVTWREFADTLITSIATEARVTAFFGVPEENLPPSLAVPASLPGDAPGKGTRIFAVLALDTEHALLVTSATVGGSYPSLTPAIPSLHLFERALHEELGIVPEGHPWLKPVRFPHAEGPRAGDMDFFTVSGDEVHEVAVGPIHAGIIECGHFRFQCYGETVMHLEISLGYHHRGIAKALEGKLTARTLPLMETIAGDTSIGHTWAACSVIEALAGCDVAPRGQAIRAVALELERLANHTGDIGALAGDIGFLPTASYCGRIRGDFLNMTASLCGNRFGRNLARPGGAMIDVDTALANDVAKRIHTAYEDVKGAADLLWPSTSVTARMMGIGTVDKKAASDIGLVGPAARACGLRRDARVGHPLPHLRGYDMHARVEKSGDVLARTVIRMREIKESAAFAARLIRHLPEGEPIAAPFAQSGNAAPASLAPASIAVSLVEGWRGEICHVGLTDDAGGFFRYNVTDPSFHNWLGLALALRAQQIADFPLCNKSFNLSYCGHDL